MRFLPWLVLFLAGCAGMTEDQCRSASWAQIGERDGVYGNRPWIDQYQHQCSRYSVPVAEKDYMEGWWVGNADYQRRTQGRVGGS
jgi:hypothetical protein